MEDQLTSQERLLLLNLARQAIQVALCGGPSIPLEAEAFPARLREPGATFVTITRRGELRGCIGTLEPHLPLIQDVCEHAVAAALEDYRFPPLQPEEIAEIRIEISRLTRPQEVLFGSPEELLSQLNPGIDGVVLRDGIHRATFLPQVWDKIPDPPAFLSHLCRKLGAPPDLWRVKKFQVFIYQVEEFHED